MKARCPVCGEKGRVCAPQFLNKPMCISDPAMLEIPCSACGGTGVQDGGR
jgi:hypothetical protein